MNIKQIDKILDLLTDYDNTCYDNAAMMRAKRKIKKMNLEKIYEIKNILKNTYDEAWLQYIEDYGHPYEIYPFKIIQVKDLKELILYYIEKQEKE